MEVRWQFRSEAELRKADAEPDVLTNNAFIKQFARSRDLGSVYLCLCDYFDYVISWVRNKYNLNNIAY